MLNNLAITQKEEFYGAHGDYVVTPDGGIIFQDGAMDENSMTGMGRMVPPPVDAYELATLKLRYAQIVAESAEQQFIDYKSYLSGTGKREPLWATFFTEEQQLKHLKSLRQSAMRARAKLSKAKKAVTDLTPAWIVEREQAEMEDAARRQRFADQVESVEL